MESFKANLVWIAPTFAVAISTIALLSSGALDRGRQAAPVTFNTAAQAAPEVVAQVQAPAPVPASAAPLTTPIEEVIAQVIVPLAATTTDAAAQDASRWDKFNQLIANASSGGTAAAPQAQPDVQEEVVTRAEPLALLETAAQDPSVDQQQATAFLNVQQEALTANSFCAEDLKALANSARVYFPAGGTTADPTGLVRARLMGQILNECPGYVVNVEGHSDPSGNSQVNLRLSQQRAETVIGRLTSAGINTSRFVAVGMGDQIPSNVTGTESTAYYDRRVEFRLVKLVEGVETASAAPIDLGWNAANTSACVARLERKAAATKVTFEPRAIILDKALLGPIADLVQEAKACPGTRVRMVGHHSDLPGLRESPTTGRLRALALMGALVGEGHSAQQLLISSPSFSVGVAGQPQAVRSRVDFQIITE